jgi:predicted nucleotidyltransferase
MNRDFSELLLAFNANAVEYLVVGAHALAAYGHVRATKDLDVWIRADVQNSERVLKAISEFGAPLRDLTTTDLTTPGTIFQIGIPPLRIDVLTEIDGVDFAEAWPDRFETKFGGVSVFVISRHHLITNKKAAARLQDLADVEQLQRLS